MNTNTHLCGLEVAVTSHMTKITKVYVVANLTVTHGRCQVLYNLSLESHTHLVSCMRSALEWDVNICICIANIINLIRLNLLKKFYSSPAPPAPYITKCSAAHPTKLRRINIQGNYNARIKKNYQTKILTQICKVLQQS